MGKSEYSDNECRAKANTQKTNVEQKKRFVLWEKFSDIYINNLRRKENTKSANKIQIIN